MHDAFSHAALIRSFAAQSCARAITTTRTITTGTGIGTGWWVRLGVVD